MNQVGPYRLERRLGAGGMGEVYLALDERLDRRVALKHVSAEHSGDEGRRERFRREAWAVARLNHPSIVQIFDVVEAEDGDWIVMELVDGPTVAELVRGRQIDVARSVSVGRHVAEGLAEAHGKGLIHRDLKAENVMISPSGRAKILDFGLAKPLLPDSGDPTLTLRGQVIGTCRAMSPEQARGLAVDARSDLFSLGVLLYEMVALESPFQGETALDTLTRVATHEQPPASDSNPALPPELAALIDRLLEKSPDRRPQTAEEVARRLLDLERSLEAAPRSESPTVRAEDATLLYGASSGDGGGEDGGGSQAEKVAAVEAGAVTLGDRETAAHPPPAEAPAPPSRWRRPPAVAGPAAVIVALAVVFLVPGVRTALLGWLGGGARVEVAAPSTPFEHYKEGMAHLERFDREGEIDAAIDSFQQALALDGDSAAALAGLARAYRLKFGNESRDRSWLDRALPIAERAVELDEHLAVARVSLGLVYAALGRTDEALAQYERALEIEPANASALSGLAKLHRSEGRLDAAEEAARQAVEASPDDRQFHDLLGTILLQTGRYSQAQQRFERSIELAPDSIYGYRNLAAAHYMQGRLGEAARALQQALAIEPDPSLYSNLGTLYFAQGLYSNAVAAFQRALELEGSAHDPRFWANLGDAYRWTSDGDEKAREAYLRASQLAAESLEATPEDTELRSRLASYRAKRGDCDAARAEIGRLEAVELTAADRYRVAVALEICGDRAAAIDALAAALVAGYSREQTEQDVELMELRADPRFHRRLMSLEPEAG